MSTTECLDREELMRHVLGKLSPERTVVIDAHLGMCQACRDAAVEVEHARDALVDDLGRKSQDAKYLAESGWKTLRPLLEAMSSGASKLHSTVIGPQAHSEVGPVACIGRYEILEQLGRGSWGAVFRAKDPMLTREVAIKVPSFHPSQDTQVATERFVREMRLMTKVHHANVCAVLDAGEENGTLFFVMDLHNGGTLRERISRGSMTLHEAVTVASKIAQGLQAIHDAGLIHRDVKPANILFTDNGEPLVSDLGLARHADDTLHLTHENSIVGTPAYMAPEQADGAEVGPSADVYALGVVLYHMLTGKLPFTGSPFEVVRQARDAERPVPSRLRKEIDPFLDDIVRKAMAARPQDRFASAAAFSAELESWHRPQPKRPRRRVRIGLVALALVFGVLVFGTLVLFSMHSSPNPENEGISDVKPDDANEQDVKKEAFGKEEPITPIDSLSLVMTPAKLPGVKRWTIRPRVPVKDGSNHQSLAWSPSGKRVAVSGWEGQPSCTVRDSERGEVEVRIDNVKFHPGCSPWFEEAPALKLALIRASTSVLSLFNEKGNASTHRVIGARVHSASAQHRRVALISAGYEVRFWEPIDNALVPGPWIGGRRSNVTGFVWHNARLTVMVQFEKSLCANYAVGERMVNTPGFALGWSPEGHLATHVANWIQLCDVRHGKPLHKLVGQKEEISSASWATLAGHLATVDAAGALKLWHLRDEKLAQTHRLPHTKAGWVFSPDGQTLACCVHNAVYFALGSDATPLGVSMLLENPDDPKRYVAISAEGHYAGSVGIADHIVYVVETEDGNRRTLSPAAFAKAYSWKNDAARVKLMSVK